MSSPPPLPPARIMREKRTVAAMIDIYCRAHHDTEATPCDKCERLLDYAYCRLDRCPFGDEKTPCARCQAHCYGPTMRARIKEVMRFAGPRMLLRHPIWALLHQWDSFRHPGKAE